MNQPPTTEQLSMPMQPAVTPPEETFGEELTRLRVGSGVSQVDVAEVCSTRQSDVSTWERGEVFPTQQQVSTLIELYPSLAARWAGAGRDIDDPAGRMKKTGTIGPSEMLRRVQERHAARMFDSEGQSARSLKKARDASMARNQAKLDVVRDVLSRQPQSSPKQINLVLQAKGLPIAGTAFVSGVRREMGIVSKKAHNFSPVKPPGSLLTPKERMAKAEMKRREVYEQKLASIREILTTYPNAIASVINQMLKARGIATAAQMTINDLKRELGITVQVGGRNQYRQSESAGASTAVVPGAHGSPMTPAARPATRSGATIADLSSALGAATQRASDLKAHKESLLAQVGKLEKEHEAAKAAADKALRALQAAAQ